MRPQAVLVLCLLIGVPLVGLGIVGLAALAMRTNEPSQAETTASPSVRQPVKQTQATRGEMGLTAFLTAQPKEPVSFRVRAKLLGYYPETVDAERASYYRIRLIEPEGDSLTAVVKKASDDGQRMFDHLKDGKTHAVRVDLQYGLPLYGSVNIVHFAPDD